MNRLVSNSHSRYFLWRTRHIVGPSGQTKEGVGRDTCYPHLLATVVFITTVQTGVPTLCAFYFAECCGSRPLAFWHAGSSYVEREGMQRFYSLDAGYRVARTVCSARITSATASALSLWVRREMWLAFSILT